MGESVPKRTPPWIVGTLAGTLVVTLFVLWERGESHRFRQAERARVLEAAANLRGRLENAVNLRLFLTQGLAAYIAQNPEIEAPVFDEMASILWRQQEGIYRISAVRGTVIRYTYPPQGREKILNRDLRTIPGQARILDQIKFQRKAVVAGPVKLVEGGRAFINFTPVFVSASGEYWGAVTTLIPERALLQEVGLLDARSSEVYALRGVDGKGAAGTDLASEVFFGDPGLFLREPVLQEALLPNGSWQLAALPRDGWAKRSPNAPGFWAVGSLCGVLVGGAVTRQLMEAERLKAEVAYRLRVEQELQESKRGLEAANRAKSDFLATMSHELRTPLHGILGYTQILQRSPCNQGEEAEALAAIRECAGHLLDWIQDILDLAKLEAGKAELAPAIVSLAEVWAAPIALAQLRARQKDLGFLVAIDPRLPSQVVADAKRLRQILLNLLSNAVKFTIRGHVRLAVERQHETPTHVQVRFAVEDTGIGIAPQDLERIFLPFEQVKTHATAEGTGLGLTIVQQLVTLMGGKLTVTSTVGVGTQFAFTVNLAIAPGKAVVSPAVVPTGWAVPIVRPDVVVPPADELSRLHALARRGRLPALQRQLRELLHRFPEYKEFVEVLSPWLQECALEPLQAFVEQTLHQTAPLPSTHPDPNDP